MLLKNEILELRAPEPQDIDRIMSLENDTSDWDASCNIAPFSRKQIWEYIANYRADIFESGQLRFMIVKTEDSQSVGMIDLFDFDAVNRRAFVGILIDGTCRGCGIGSMALELLADYCYRRLGMHQLVATTAVDNHSAVELFKSCGYRISGRLQSWLRRGESYRDVYVMQRLLTKSEQLPL